MSKSGYELQSETSSQSNSWVPLHLRDRLSLLQIIATCSSMISFQIAFAAEFALGTPMMKHLGVSQSMTTVIWLVGPLSGFIVQPLVGFYSDCLLSRFGRRRPFIVVGAIGILLGFGGILLVDVFPIGGWAIAFFVFSLLLTNVSINTLQGPSRAIVGDVIPKAQQQLGNMVASVMIGIAGVIGNVVGGFDLGKSTGWLSTQHLVFVVGGILVAIGAFVTVVTTPEEPLLERPERGNPFVELWTAFKTVPGPILRVALIYSVSWMAYMPFQVEVTDFFGVDIYLGDASKNDYLYQQGCNFGMKVTALANGVVLLYGFVHEPLVKRLGLKLTYALSQVLVAILLVLVFFVKDRWALMGILAPLGISCMMFNTVPFQFVGLVVAPEKMGMYMGVLNSFGVIGQQISNFLLGSGVGALTDKKAPIIGSGAALAVIGAIGCYWMTVPSEKGVEMIPADQGDQMVFNTLLAE